MVKKRGKKNFSLKEEYRDSWGYIKDSRNFIYIVIGIFLIFGLIGFFIPAPDFLMEQILDFIRELLEKTQAMSQMELIQFIFFNNLKSSFFGMVFGIALGIFPLFSSIINGYILGFVASMTVEGEGFSILWRLLPHGIFELPAVFISLGLGLKLGTFVFYEKKLETFKEFFWSSLKVFLFIVIPLLILAGIIEGSLVFLLR